MAKIIVILFLLSIFFSLGSGLYYLVRDKQISTRTVKALTWRLALSIILFILLMISYAMGWITPHPVIG